MCFFHYLYPVISDQYGQDTGEKETGELVMPAWDRIRCVLLCGLSCCRSGSGVAFLPMIGATFESWHIRMMHVVVEGVWTGFGYMYKAIPQPLRQQQRCCLIPS